MCEVPPFYPPLTKGWEYSPVNLTLTNMKKVTIIGIGINKNSKPFIRVAYFEGNFKVVKYVEVLSTADYEIDQEIEVPNVCLA